MFNAIESRGAVRPVFQLLEAVTLKWPGCVVGGRGSSSQAQDKKLRLAMRAGGDPSKTEREKRSFENFPCKTES